MKYIVPTSMTMRNWIRVCLCVCMGCMAALRIYFNICFHFGIGTCCGTKFLVSLWATIEARGTIEREINNSQTSQLGFFLNPQMLLVQFPLEIIGCSGVQLVESINFCTSHVQQISVHSRYRLIVNYVFLWQLICILNCRSYLFLHIFF